MANFVINVFSPHLMFELFDLAHVDVVQLAELLLNERLHLLDLAIELAGQVVQLVLEEHVSRGMETKVLHRNPGFSLFARPSSCFSAPATYVCHSGGRALHGHNYKDLVSAFSLSLSLAALTPRS